MSMWILCAALVMTALGGCTRSPGTEADQAAVTTVTVFAAASTTDVLREAARRFESAGRARRIAFSFDSSSSLARQIKAGAPAELFISADAAWMDDVVAAGAARAETRVDLLTNELVLIAPIGREFHVRMSRDFDAADGLSGVTRIALGDPSHVPAGRYARQALEALGWWDALRDRIVPAPDVRAALRLVELGEADAGVVYATDAARSAAVVVVAGFPASTHQPIRYPMALCGDASDLAAEFAQFLRSPEMREVFERAGFCTPEGRCGAGKMEK
jgi:molybdate transport system substrate-binding protein